MGPRYHATLQRMLKGHLPRVTAPLGRARLETPRARLGTEKLGRARLGAEGLGRARLGAKPLGRARLGTEGLGRARLGTGEEAPPRYTRGPLRVDIARPWSRRGVDIAGPLDGGGADDASAGTLRRRSWSHCSHFRFRRSWRFRRGYPRFRRGNPRAFSYFTKRRRVFRLWVVRGGQSPHSPGLEDNSSSRRGGG